MQLYRYCICIAVFITVSISSFAQPDPPPRAPRAQLNEPGTGLWFGLYTKLRLGEKLYYYAETHYRRRNSLDNRLDFAGRMGQVYNRHGINYLFNPYFELTAGPVVVLNYSPQPDNPEYRRMMPEYRFWHQWLFIQPQMGRFKVYHQFRFEHRYKSYNHINDNYNYTNRYRYKVFSYIPLNKSYLSDGALFLAPSAEIFLHSGETVVYHPLEDFRVYTGLGYIINHNFMLFGGHMWTIGQSPVGFEYGQSHVIRINLYMNFDLRRKSKTIPRVHMED